MRERLELIIEELKLAMEDVEKVESGMYGYKAAAPRAPQRRRSSPPQFFQKNGSGEQVQSSSDQKVGTEIFRCASLSKIEPNQGLITFAAIRLT